MNKQELREQIRKALGMCNDKGCKSKCTQQLDKAMQLIEAHTDKAVKEAVAKLSNLYGTARCENLHHPKKWQHKASDGCPVEQAIKELQEGK